MAFVATLLFVAALFPTSRAASPHVASPSGRLLPLPLIRRHLPNHPTHLLAAAVFEHHPQTNSLHSSHHRIPLDLIAPHYGLIREHAGLTLSLNGHPADLPDTNAYVRRGGNHVYAFVQEDNRDVLVAGFAPGIALRPLDVHQFPGIYINYHPTTSIDATSVAAPSSETAASTPNDVDSALSRQAVSACQPSSPDIWYEIAFSFDKSFCAQYNNVQTFAIAAIQAAVLAANVPFQAQSCIRLALVHIDAFCASSPTDPFAAPANPTAERIQENYRVAYQNAPFNAVRRDVAMLVSGYENIPGGGGVDPAGIAGQGTICNNEFNFAWVEILIPALVAHEFGHTLNAQHDDSVRNIMNTIAQLDDPFEFSPLSLQEMTTAITGTNGACATTDAPVCDATCPNGAACTNGICITPPPTPPTGNGVLCSRVGAFGCSVSLDRANNPDTKFSRDCPTEFNFVQRTAVNTSDYDIFCCTAPIASQANTEVISRNFRLPSLQLLDGSLVPDFIAPEFTQFVQTVTLITATLDLTCASAGTVAPTITTSTTTTLASTITTSAPTSTTSSTTSTSAESQTMAVGATSTTAIVSTDATTITATATTTATTTTTTTTSTSTTTSTTSTSTTITTQGTTFPLPLLPGPGVTSTAVTTTTERTRLPLPILPGPGATTAAPPVVLPPPSGTGAPPTLIILPGEPSTSAPISTDPGGLPVLPGPSPTPTPTPDARRRR